MRAILVANRKLFLMGLLLVAGAFCVLAVDNDNDGMSDAYELFFGLNPSVDDASDNNDSDSLSNYQESLLWTDPFVSDTDEDGWLDDADSNAVSRALIPWGDPQFTDANDMVTYSWPLWMTSAWAVDGAWTTNSAYAWHSSYADGSNAGWLNMDVDRTLFSSNLVMRLDFYDHTNSSMFIDLYDTNDLITVTNLYGNLTTGTDTNITQTIEIPFADYSSAAGIHIRKGDGAMTIYQSLLYIDADLDGLDASQEEQLGTSDTNPDTDGDGISDFDEVFTHGTNPLSSDTDGDGLSDLAEIQTYSTDPLLSDTDGDGIDDGLEVNLGKDPVSSNSYSALPFVERFETNTVSVGDIHGQNSWEASKTNSALAQTHTVYDGAQALELANQSIYESVSVSHIFATPDSDVVWVDLFTKAKASSAPTDSTFDEAAIYFFNSEGYIEAYDGLQSAGNRWVVLTNMTPVNVETGAWVRLTVKLDYNAQEWLVCLNGQFVADGLGFASYKESFAAVTVDGQSGNVDNFAVSINAPAGIDADDDGLSDSWELQYFSDLDEVGSGDPDSDGLTNLQEYQAGSSPILSDTDGDGVSDAKEVSLGKDPATSNSYHTLPFVEMFETNTVTLGDLYGQNHWDVSVTNVAMVQTNTVYEGLQAMELNVASGMNADAATVQHVFAAGEAQYVWVDAYTKPIPGSALAESDLVGVAGCWYFNAEHQLMVWDGSVSGTNKWVVMQHRAVEEDDWVRTTVALDYTSKTWSAFINGVKVAADITFADTNVQCMSAYSVVAGSALVDGISISTNQPSGMSVDTDADGMPDDWEMTHFGDLSATDTGDPDSDGASNLQEYLAETDPHDSDTDDDGMPDGWEIDNGLNPLVDDTALDPDGDTLTNLQEYNNGTDSTNPLDTDSDSDGMPDNWEIANGLDPNDASDASLDPDSDGLTNLGEYQAGSDPTLVDTDADGMPDGWEVDNGTNPLVDDADADLDGDRLSNLGEYHAGTDPQDADTDDDGTDDFIEATQAFSNPLVADFDGSVSAVATVNGSDSTDSLGTWSTEGSHIYARERSGYVEYTITLPSNDLYALAVEVTQHNSLTAQDTFDLSLYIDGAYSGRQRVIAPYGSTADATFFLPKLDADSYTARIVWKNLSPNTFLQINQLTLQSYGGTDTNSNGVADWQENRQTNTSQMDAPVETSYVSPVCLEGESHYQDQLAVSASYEQTVAVKQGVGSGWYADVQLSPTNDTSIQVAEQDGSITYSNTVAWQAFNLFDVATNSMSIRYNSDMLLTAYPTNETTGVVALEVLLGTNVVTNIVTDIATPVQFAFDQSGDYTISGTFTNANISTNTTRSIESILNFFPLEEMVTVASVPRIWDCPGIGTNTTIEYDAALDVTDISLTNNTRQFVIINQYDTAYHMVARLGEDGPIMDSVKISSVYADNGSYFKIVESFTDGSRVVEVRLQLGYVPDDIEVMLNIFVGGVTFEDGTLLKTLTASDFDELGATTYRLIQSAGSTTSVCHSTTIYQGATYLWGNR